MKKYSLFVMIAAVLVAAGCSKSDSNTDTGIKTIRYDFTTTNAADYSIQAIADTLVYTENATALTWSKTVTVTGSDSAFLTVFPPAAWLGTTNEADVTVKITVNDVEKASANAHFIAIDRPNGLKVGASY
ncbi:MAG: hypothetical protein ABIN36_17190 [Ferruginibacter sp.]